MKGLNKLAGCRPGMALGWLDKFTILSNSRRINMMLDMTMTTKRKMNINVTRAMAMIMPIISLILNVTMELT